MLNKDSKENLWNTYTKLQRGKGKTRKQIVQDYPAWKKKRASTRGGRNRFCAIDQMHVEIVRKTFKALPKPTSAESNCAILSEFFQLPSSIEIRSKFSHSNPQPEFFVYSGNDGRSKKVVIKVANLQKEKNSPKGKLVSTTRCQFDFMVLTHKAIKKSLRSGFYVPKCGLASTNNFVGFNIMEHVDGAHLASKMNKSSAIRRDLMTKLGSALAHFHKIGGHGDAHFENILVTPSRKLCLIDFERAVVFRQAKAGPRHKYIARLYDLMNVTVSILAKGRVGFIWKEIVSPNASQNADLRSFIQAYYRVTVKYMSEEELSRLTSGHAEFLYRVENYGDTKDRFSFPDMFLAYHQEFRNFRMKAAR